MLSYPAGVYRIIIYCLYKIMRSYLWRSIIARGEIRLLQFKKASAHRDGNKLKVVTVMAGSTVKWIYKIR
jgi:hypothetical protein